MSRKIGEIKNIVVSTHDPLHPIIGGGALRTLKVAYELKKRGYNVVIIGPANNVDELNGIKICKVSPPTKQYSQILSAIKFNIHLLIKFIRFLILSKVDIFFIHNTIAAITMPFFKKIFRFAFVLDITDIHAEYLPFGRRNVFERILTPHLLRYEYFIVNSADFVTVATETMKVLLVSKGINPKKIKVVYDGVDKEDIPQKKEEGAEFGIIHLGMVDRQHGVDLIIQATPAVIKEFPQAKFFFVGGGRELLNIKKLAKNLGVVDKCIFTDCLPCAKAREFLNKVTIGIIPRRDYLPNRIITTLKIYEYWASRTAVISSYLEGIREIASDGSILWFKPGDIKDLEEKIKLLLKDREVKERLIEEGLTTIDRFEFLESASKIVDFTLDNINL